jgi:hypothetical protein
MTQIGNQHQINQPLLCGYDHACFVRVDVSAVYIMPLSVARVLSDNICIDIVYMGSFTSSERCNKTLCFPFGVVQVETFSDGLGEFPRALNEIGTVAMKGQPAVFKTLEKANAACAKAAEEYATKVTRASSEIYGGRVMTTQAYPLKIFDRTSPNLGFSFPNGMLFRHDLS